MTHNAYTRRLDSPTYSTYRSAAYLHRHNLCLTEILCIWFLHNYHGILFTYIKVYALSGWY